jgi:type IV pilus assembly protein PilQ
LSKQGRVWVDTRAPVVYLIDTDEYLKKGADDLTQNDFPPLQTEIFSLTYAEVSQAADKVKDLLTPNLGTVRFDEAANTLVVTDTAEKIAQVAEFIKRLDQKLEVTLNVAIYKVQLNEEHQDGIDWEAIVANFKKVDLLSEKADRSSEKNRLCLGTLSEEDYEVLLEALETVGTVTRLGEEQVTAVMNRQVALEVDTQGKDADAVKGAGPSPKAAAKQGGFSLPLLVKPWLNDNNTLILDLAPQLIWREDGPLRRDASFWENFSPQPRIQEDMGNKDVLVIGGLLREKEVKRISKFPLLGDLPIFSLVFRHQNRWIERTEYLVFIVPQVNQEKQEK